MKNILITNDDGFDSKGLLSLLDSLKDIANVIVVAPSSEKSACGHGLTLREPLRFIEIEKNYYKLHDGTPSDCVYLALKTLYKNPPDLIISGINLGSNMGEDVTYSGTVAGAMEGALREIPSIAISQVLNKKQNHDFVLAKKVTRDVVIKIMNSSFPLRGRKLLNINIPDIEINEYKGLKITELGYRIYGNDAMVNTNPKGEEYYWLGLHPLNWMERENNNSDFQAIHNGYTSITPLTLNITSYEDVNTLQRWI